MRWLLEDWCKACHAQMHNCMCGRAKATHEACGLDLQRTLSSACVADTVVAMWLILHGRGAGSCIRSCAISGCILSLLWVIEKSSLAVPRTQPPLTGKRERLRKWSLSFKSWWVFSGAQGWVTGPGISSGSIIMASSWAWRLQFVRLASSPRLARADFAAGFLQMALFGTLYTKWNINLVAAEPSHECALFNACSSCKNTVTIMRRVLSCLSSAQTALRLLAPDCGKIVLRVKILWMVGWTAISAGGPGGSHPW